MKRLVRSGVVVLGLCALSLVGCETKRIWLQISGIDDGSVQGIWLWRLSEVTGSYERTCRFPFEGTQQPGTLEVLAYFQQCEGDQANNGFAVPIKRSPTQPDSITVGLWYVAWNGAGVYKVSAYGIDGETALSDSSRRL